MNVVDAGAHHGLYTLRMSRLVGRTGRVLAVEPSPRERKRLARHIRVNGCWNVEVESCALGAEEREAELFLVEGIQDWCNSLRPPEIEERSSRIQVAVRRLDDVLAQRKMERVDFIKMDVEGAEWSVLRGATGLLSGEARPAILAEVQDARTRAWGYAAREIIRFLAGRNYRWFALAAGDALQPVPTERAEFDGNLVALPEERAEEFQKMLVEKAEA
jgi:FkbM family methyltransferase